MLRKNITLLVFLVLLGVLLYIIREKLAAYYNNMGIESSGRGAYRQAIAHFERSLQINPSMSIANCNLADTYVKSGQPKKAVEVYLKVLQKDPACLQAYLGLGATYAEENKFTVALAVLERAEQKCKELQPINHQRQKIIFHYIASLFAKGVDAFLTGKRQDALVFLQQALQVKPDFVYGHYMRAYVYFDAQEYALAEEELREVMRLDPQFSAGYKLLGDLYFAQGYFEKAFNAYSQALDNNAQDTTVLNDAGLALMEMERYIEATRYLEQAARLAPGNIHIIYSLACLYRDNQAWKEAVLVCAKVIAAHPDYPNIHNVLAEVYISLARNEEAHAEFQREIEGAERRLIKDPLDAFTYSAMARAFNGLQEYPKALEAVKKAIELQPKYRDAYLTYAATLEKLGNQGQALAALEKAKKLSQSAYFVESEITRVKSLPPLPLGSIGLADTLYLKNGRQLSGRIRRETDQEVVVEINIGGSVGSVSIARDTIESIKKHSP